MKASSALREDGQLGTPPQNGVELPLSKSNKSKAYETQSRYIRMQPFRGACIPMSNGHFDSQRGHQRLHDGST